MATRKAYAASNDGLSGLMFASAKLRDFFLENIEGYRKSTCAEYRKIKRNDEDSLDEWGNTVGFSSYNALDMSVAEYWDGWWDVYDRAAEAGLV